jgi:hypothetical protein
MHVYARAFIVSNLKCEVRQFDGSRRISMHEHGEAFEPTDRQLVTP